MPPLARNLILVCLTAVTTFVASAWYFKRQIRNEAIPDLINEFNKVDSFNDLGRLQEFDRLEEFLKQGCSKEALQFVEVQQSLLLSGIAHKASQNEDLGKYIRSENFKIFDRAIAEAKRANPPRSIPKCNAL